VSTRRAGTQYNEASRKRHPRSNGGVSVHCCALETVAQSKVQHYLNKRVACLDKDGA